MWKLSGREDYEFLSRLCGGEATLFRRKYYKNFLSRLCGGEETP